MNPVNEMDAELRAAVRRSGWMRQGFYIVVLLVALAGQVSGAVETLHIPLAAAIPAVGALELGGIVVLANADVRRRLGERATASRVLSAGIAAGAVAFNWLAHADHLLGGFFAGMSALGYLVWLMHTENQRRDRLRAKGTLAWTTPAYEVVGHWLAHPWLTRRARALAKADPTLGLYDSLDEARAAVRRERRERAIAKVLHRKIRAAVDPTTADIAVHVYDLDEIAARLADGADYDGLTALIAVDLEPRQLALAAAVQPVTDAATATTVDAVPDTLGGDIGRDNGGDTATGVGLPKPRVTRTPRKATTAERVAAAKKRTPEASPAAIAKRLGVTERTVQRHLASMTVADVMDAGTDDTVSDSPPVNYRDGVRRVGHVTPDTPLYADAWPTTEPHNGSPAAVV